MLQADDGSRYGENVPDDEPHTMELRTSAYHDVLGALALIAGHAQLLVARLGSELALPAQQDLAALLHGVQRAEMQLTRLRVLQMPPTPMELEALTARMLREEAASAESAPLGEFAVAELMCLLMQAALDALGSTGGDLDLLAERTGTGWELRAVLHPPGSPPARGPIDQLWRLHLCAVVAERLGGRLSLTREPTGVSYVISLPVTQAQDNERTT